MFVEATFLRKISSYKDFDIPDYISFLYGLYWKTKSDKKGPWIWYFWVYIYFLINSNAHLSFGIIIGDQIKTSQSSTRNFNNRLNNMNEKWNAKKIHLFFCFAHHLLRNIFQPLNTNISVFCETNPTTKSKLTYHAIQLVF